MDRYVVIDNEGWITNVILWDGISPLSIQEGFCLELESITLAQRKPIEQGDVISE